MPNLQLVSATEGKGAAYARNEGARVARATKLLFCDGDDIVDVGWLAAMTQAMETHQFVTGSLDTEKLNKDNYWVRRTPPNGSKIKVLDFLPYAVSCNVGISREVFEKVGGFSEEFIHGQDIDLSWRLHLNGCEVHDVPEAIVFYRFRQNLKDTWRQITAYAVSHVHLYQHFAHYGMPRSSFRVALRRYRWLIKRAYCLVLHRPQCRVKWIYTAALCWGRFKGSIRYRKFYL
jgi:GT2 family glycosyltransferase